ncbi:hypothetical protein ACQZV8_21595, partial [Magnetococcales bacterium HHB-1]
MRSLNDLTIQSKILFLSVVFFIASLGASGFALVKIDHIGNEVREVAQQDLPVTRILSQITVHQFELAIVFERALRFGAGDNNLALSEQIKTLLNSFQRISREVEHEIDR